MIGVMNGTFNSPSMSHAHFASKSGPLMANGGMPSITTALTLQKLTRSPEISSARWSPVSNSPFLSPFEADDARVYSDSIWNNRVPIFDRSSARSRIDYPDPCTPAEHKSRLLSAFISIVSCPLRPKCKIPTFYEYPLGSRSDMFQAACLHQTVTIYRMPRCNIRAG